MAFNILNGLFMAAFIASAAVQYNDPDAIEWILLYTAAAGICAAQYAKLLPHWLPLMTLFISVIWLLGLSPAMLSGVSWHEVVASLSMQTTAVEEAREMGGLALVALWSAVLAYRGRRAP